MHTAIDLGGLLCLPDAKEAHYRAGTQLELNPTKRFTGMAKIDSINIVDKEMREKVLCRLMKQFHREIPFFPEV